MHEELLSNERRKADDEVRRIQDEEDRRQPDVVEGLRAQRAVSGKRRFTRASVEANTRWTDHCRTLASSTNTLVTPVNCAQDTPRNPDPEEPRSPRDSDHTPRSDDHTPRDSDFALHQTDETISSDERARRKAVLGSTQDTHTRPAQAYLRIPPPTLGSGTHRTPSSVPSPRSPPLPLHQAPT